MYCNGVVETNSSLILNCTPLFLFVYILELMAFVELHV